MNNDIKKFLDENLVFTNDREKSLTFDTVYDVYYLNCKDYGKEPVNEFKFKDALNEYVETNPRGIVTEEYYFTIDKDTLDYYRSCFDSGVLPSEPIKDKENTFTLISGTKTAKGKYNNVLIFSTLGKKHDKDLLNAYKSRIIDHENEKVVHAVISEEAMELLKEYIKVLDEAYHEKAELLAEYEAEE
ncbi:hypothetical protein [Megamonas hypermegale]|uniref:hypothetical protein n=1 Tax=Megamonas hypermegale TaxID=158847 RepID=UPI0026F261DC|nr:hypothetical protein [Megamonas hypermegale]